MNEISITPTEHHVAGGARHTWRWIKTGLVVLSILGLGALNILTFVSEEIHAAGYNVIKSLLSSAAGEAATSRILSKSPTSVRTRSIAKETEVLQRENKTLSDSNKTIINKHATLEKAHKEINTNHAELARTADLRAVATKSFTKRLATRSAVNAARNLSSVPAEAIPYIGIGIVVGVTALDIYDACETLKEINVLNAGFGGELEDQDKVCGLKVPTHQQVIAKVKQNLRGTYETAADLLNKGGAMVPAAPPRVSWSDMKGAVCPLVDGIPSICP